MNKIPIFLAFLALILIILGLIRLTMTIFGFKRLKNLDNKFQITLSNIGITIETQYLGLACIGLGLMMVIISAWLSGKVGKVAEATVIEETIATTPKLAEGGYTISEEEVRIDLRKRKDLGVMDYLAGELIETEWLVRRVVKNVGSSVEQVNFRHATSGHSIVPIHIPEGATWRKIEEESKEVVSHPFIDVLRGEFFKNLIERKGRMRSYYLTVAITDGKGQEIVYKLKYHNAFQGKDFEWAGKIFSANTDVLTMHVTFPEDKPFKGFETYKMAPDAKNKVRISDPEIASLHGNHILTWNIRNAKKGEKYFIKWLW